MALPDEGRKLIETKLDMALRTDLEDCAQKQFGEVCAMLDYAMAVGHLTPAEFGNWRQLVKLNQQRRNYKPLN